MKSKAEDYGKHAKQAQDQAQSRKRAVRDKQADTLNTSQNKQYKTECHADLQTARCNALTILTHNMMGTTTMLSEVAMTAGNKNIDIRVFTETIQTESSQYKKGLEECLPEYKMYHSCNNRKDKTGRKRKQPADREGAAGVTIALHKSLLTQSTVNPVRMKDPAAKGHCKAVTITPPGSDCLVAWGLYKPSCQGLIDGLADQGIKSQTTEALSENLQQILLHAVPIAQSTCDYTKAGQSDYMKYPKRIASRKNKALTEYRTAHQPCHTAI